MLYRALALQARGDRDAAARDFTRVAEHADDPHQQAFALATAVDLALDSATPGTALASAERLVRARPGVDSHLRHGRVLEALDRYTDADRAYAAALRDARDPADRLRVLEARAVLAERRRDWDGARRELLDILAADARDESVRRRLGEVAWARKDFKDSARWFRESAAVSGSAQDRERLARALYASSDYRAGVQELRRAAAQVDATEDRHRLLMAIAYGHTKLGQTREAVESFRDAAALRADAPTLTALAEALIRAGRPVEAATALTPLAARDATGRTHLRIATLYTKSRRWHDALHHLAASAAADQAGPIRTEVYRQQGHILYTLERYADARRAFEQSLQHGGADARLYVALGETCMKLNAYADAVGYLKQALALTDGKTGR
jgi:tetratricopeptide (TPR) repeat protein